MTSRTRHGFHCRADRALGFAAATVIGAWAVAQDRAWIERNNAFTQWVIRVRAEFQPEGASQSGLQEYGGLLPAALLSQAVREKFVPAMSAR